jgi:hypothetical protein
MEILKMEFLIDADRPRASTKNSIDDSRRHRSPRRMELLLGGGRPRCERRARRGERGSRQPAAQGCSGRPGARRPAGVVLYYIVTLFVIASRPSHSRAGWSRQADVHSARG